MIILIPAQDIYYANLGSPVVITVRTNEQFDKWVQINDHHHHHHCQFCIAILFYNFALQFCFTILHYNFVLQFCITILHCNFQRNDFAVNLSITSINVSIWLSRRRRKNWAQNCFRLRCSISQGRNSGIEIAGFFKTELSLAGKISSLLPFQADLWGHIS